MIKRIFSLVALIGAIIVPLSASAASYLIERGDTLTSIAREFGVSVRDIAVQNDIKDVNKIYAGATLEINSANTDEGVDGDVLGGPGGAYTPVTGYQSRITTYISSAATTVPVASTKDKAGNQIVLADISSSSTAKVYLSLATGTSKEEIIACTGLTSASWTGCSRGLSFQGGSMTASTTLSYAHNAGESIIITDVGQFFNEFVSISGNQTIFDRKTFYAFPIVTSTTALPTLGSELANKYYVDNVGAGGFTASNVSTTRGLSVDGSAPERVGVNASTTRGLAFDNNGTSNWPIYINASSTGGINFSSAGTIQVDGSDNFIFSGTVTSTGVLRGQTPTDTSDVAIKSYVDNKRGFGDGSDGDVTISSPTTITRDMYYNTLTLTGANDLTSGGYRIFVKGALTRNAASTAKITSNGGAGGNASGATGGTAGTTSTGITVPSGVAGKAGANGASGSGNAAGGAGTAGASVTFTLDASNGSAGGAGGSGTTSITPASDGGAAGGAGTATESKAKPRIFLTAMDFTELSENALYVQRPSAGSGSGGGGGIQGGGGAATGGGGGGSGGSGGVLFVAATSIVDNGTGTMFEAVGGAGGNGGNGAAVAAGAGAGGGGGGAGGNGGIIVRLYNTITGSGTTSVAGGAGGTGGLKDTVASGVLDVDGSAGAAGATGTVFNITD